MNSQKINTMVVLSLLFFLFLGIFSFNLYTEHGSDTLTSATVVSMNKETQSENQETSAKNKITGMSVSITGAPTAEEEPQTSETNGEKQIGTYTVLPSFSFPEKGNFVSDYDTLQKQIRLFYEAVNDCKISNPSEILENCIQDALAQPEYSNWLSESDCETDEERVFYDLTQDLSDCSQSEDSDCTCTFPFPKNYAAGNYIFAFAAEGNDLLISLQDSSLSTTLPSLALLNNGNPLASETYTLTATEDGATAGFSSSSDTLYLYKKDDSTLSLEDETTFTTAPSTRTACTLFKKTAYKFCTQSQTTVSQYDTGSQKTITEPLVYVFAIDFSS